MANNRDIKFSYWSTVSIFFLSMVLIAFQLLLMRALSVSRYFHFSYLVISTALLGFGASGTFLTFTYNALKKRAPGSVLYLHLFLIISIPACYLLASQLPLDVQYLFFSTEQFLLLLIYNLLIFIPFFLGAVIIGFKLTYFKKNVPELYGANLIGSGAGGISAIGLMYLAPATQLPLLITGFVLAGLICWIMASRHALKNRIQPILIVFVGIIVTIISLFISPDFTIDPYKSLSNFQRLQQQQDARHVVRRYGPRAQIDIYDSPAIHKTLFAGLTADTIPPSQMAVLFDGHTAGTIFKTNSVEDTRILDFTPQSLPYRLIDNTNVLLLGEVGGSNILLAKRHGAEEITVVQTNPQLLSLMRDSLIEENGNIFNDPKVRVINKYPRLFLEQTDEKFDIIQFVTAESMPSGTGGLQGLRENYLLTVESIESAYTKLTPKGIITLTRGMQTPARDNIKIFALLTKMLETVHIENPAMHLMQSRNYLAVNTLLTKYPIDEDLFESYKLSARKLNMDINFGAGFATDTVQINTIENPDKDARSYYQYAAQELIWGDKEAFFDSWVYNVRPPTDNQPYFDDFFKWASISRFVETYGKFWFRRVELGYAVLVVTFLELALAGFALILLPLFALKQTFRKVSNKLHTLLFFGAIALGFMFLEMVYIQLFTKFMGDPIYSVSAALTSILVSSGMGSSVQNIIPGSPGKRIKIAVVILSLVVLLYLWQLDAILSIFIDFGTGIRFLVTVLLLFPAAFFMGWMFPNGMALVEKNTEQLVPWAWGVNGFFSVVASPLAVILSMAAGFNSVLLLALLCYFIAAGTTILWEK